MNRNSTDSKSLGIIPSTQSLNDPEDPPYRPIPLSSIDIDVCEEASEPPTSTLNDQNTHDSTEQKLVRAISNDKIVQQLNSLENIDNAIDLVEKSNNPRSVHWNRNIIIHNDINDMNGLANPSTDEPQINISNANNTSFHRSYKENSNLNRTASFGGKALYHQPSRRTSMFSQAPNTISSIDDKTPKRTISFLDPNMKSTTEYSTKVGSQVELLEKHERKLKARQDWNRAYVLVKTLRSLREGSVSLDPTKFTPNQLDLLHSFVIHHKRRLSQVSKRPSVVGDQSLGRIINLMSPLDMNLNTDKKNKTPGRCVQFLEKIFCVEKCRKRQGEKDKKNKKIEDEGAEEPLVPQKKYAFQQNRRPKTNIAQLRKPFKPDSRVKLVWDIYMIMLVMVNMVILPLLICFDLTNLDAFQNLCNVSFFLDIFLSFHTSYYSHGNIVESHAKIAKKYAKSWLVVDFIVAFPFYVFDDYNATDGTNQKSSLFTFLRFFQILKVLRALKFFKLNRIFLKLKAYVGSSADVTGIIEVSKLFIIVLTVAHWLACGWIFLESLEIQLSSDPDNQVTWLNVWMGNKGFSNLSDGKIYLYALYWSITTMLTVGYGDLTPQTEAETIYNIVAMLFGCAVFAYSLGTISSIIQDMSREKSKLE